MRNRPAAASLIADLVGDHVEFQSFLTTAEPSAAFAGAQTPESMPFCSLPLRAATMVS